MDIRKTIIAWNYGVDDIKFGPIMNPRNHIWTRGYTFTAGAAYAFVQRLNDIEAEAYVLAEAIEIIATAKMTPVYVYEMFERIKQFRSAILRVHNSKMSI